MIKQAALHTSGVAGPSGLDALSWRRLCTSFTPGVMLGSLSCFGSKTFVHWDCRPWMHRMRCTTPGPPSHRFGQKSQEFVGDTAKRIIAKAILNVVRQDVQEAAGSVQLCAGQISGIEAAACARCSLFLPKRRNWSSATSRRQQCLQLPQPTNCPTQHPEAMPIPCHSPHQHL